VKESLLSAIEPHRQVHEENNVLRFAASAGALIVAGGLVAAVNSASPFAHGSWLAAYLVLVGGAAQVALGLAPVALPVAPPSRRLVRAQLVLWNAGALIVPAGVLGDSLAVVAIGSAALLAALLCFVAGARPTGGGGPGGVFAYRALAVVLGMSVVIGCGLVA
jgi:hypothetical protein